MLTLSRLREVLDYDPDTGVFRWAVQLSSTGLLGSVAGCVQQRKNRSGSDIAIRIDKKLYVGHRLAWFITHGVMPVGQIDHKDKNSCNNRIENLRLASNGENGRNRSKYSTNKSGWKGVSWDKERGKWKSQITVDRKNMVLGRFDDIKEAAETYMFAALEYHGDFARLE